MIVPAEINLDELHVILQGVMGWEFEHLYCFEIGKLRYMDEDHCDEDCTSCRMANEFSLKEALGRKKTFTYTYDFGDNWIPPGEPDRR